MCYAPGCIQLAVNMCVRHAPHHSSMQVNEIVADAQGWRMDASYAYLYDVMGPSGRCNANLRVVQGVTATRILLQNGKAFAVATKEHRGTEVVLWHACKEVILTAGPYGSPKLLQLSGIGPSKVLQQHGISVTHDLPVGQHAQARPIVITLNKCALHLFVSLAWIFAAFQQSTAVQS